MTHLPSGRTLKLVFIQILTTIGFEANTDLHNLCLLQTLATT